MKISKKCEYALRFLIYLMINEDKTLSLKTIANKFEIPFKFLTLIVIDLKKNGLVESVKGPGGGFYLSEQASESSLKEIIEIMDGKINTYKINFNTISKEETAFVSHVIKESLDLVSQSTFKIMRQITLRDLANKYFKIANTEKDFSI